MIPFVILGLYQQFPDSSGYTLLQHLKTSHYDYVVHVTKGSFYYNLQQAAAKGWLVPLPNQDPTAKDHRYRITPPGQTEFRRLFLKYGQQNDVTTATFYTVFLFANQARDLMPSVLTAQIKATQAKMAATTAALTAPEDMLPNFATILKNTLAHHRANLAWFHDLQRQFPE